MPGPCAIGVPLLALGNISSDLVEKMSTASKQPFEKGSAFHMGRHPAPKARPHGGSQAACESLTQTCTCEKRRNGEDERGSPPRPPVTWGDVPNCKKRELSETQNVVPRPQSKSLTIRVSTHTRTNMLTEPSNGLQDVGPAASGARGSAGVTAVPALGMKAPPNPTTP